MIDGSLNYASGALNRTSSYVRSVDNDRAPLKSKLSIRACVYACARVSQCVRVYVCMRTNERVSEKDEREMTSLSVQALAFHSFRQL